MAFQLGYTGSEINARLGEVPNKADKVIPSAVGNIPTLGITGNLVDSGFSAVQLMRAVVPHGSATGFPVSLTQAANFPILSMRAPGLCSQVGTPSPTSFAPLHTIEGDVKLVVCRKNILPASSLYMTGAGLDAVINADGSITITGTLTQAYNVIFDISFTPPANTPVTFFATVVNHLDGGGLPRNAGIKLRGTSDHDFTARDTANLTLTATFDPAHWAAPTMTPRLAVYHTLGDVTDYHYTIYPTIAFGNNPLAWEPFEGGLYPLLDLGSNFMGSLPDGTADELVVDDWGNVTLTKRVGRIVLNGSSNITAASTDTEGTYRYYIPVSDCKDVETTVEVGNFYCDRLPNSSASLIYRRTTGIGYRNPGTNGFFIYAPDFSSGVSALKTWLTAQPMTVYYPLSAERSVSLGRVRLPSLLRGVNTVFLNTNNGLASNLTMEYAKDTTLVFEAKGIV